MFLLRANKNPLLSIFGPSETEVDRQGAAAASQQVKALKGQTDEKLNFDEWIIYPYGMLDTSLES